MSVRVNRFSHVCKIFIAQNSLASDGSPETMALEMRKFKKDGQETGRWISLNRVMKRRF